MHEFALARRLVDAACRAAYSEDGDVVSMMIELGPGHMDADALRANMEAAAHGSRVAGACIEIRPAAETVEADSARLVSINVRSR